MDSLAVLRRCIGGTALALVPLLLTCESPTGPPPEITELPRQLSTSEEEVVRASNRFAFDLAHRISEPDSNFFVSPLSASMALGMTMNGAVGETYDQMRDVLGFGDLSQDEINASYESLIELLLGLDPRVEIAIGNSVWHDEVLEVRASFLETVRRHFDAQIEALDFSDPGTSDRINAWVEEATRGHIDEIVPEEIPPEIVMYLINAIYFRGDWAEQFDPEKTADAPFERPDGSTVTVPMMEREFEELGHHAGPGYQAVDLPYGGGAFSMTVVVPSSDGDVESVLGSLDAQGWRELGEELREGKVRVFLPRFELEYDRMLNDDLEALGMTEAFDRRLADFSGLFRGGEDAWIDEVRQKAFVSVDEEGTEAAAATSVGVGVVSAPPTIRADRPFLFAIRERLTGTILFLGKVVNPAER